VSYFRDGQEVLVNDGRPNAELLLSVGTMQNDNMSNYLLFPAQLVSSDKYYSLKQQVVQSLGFSDSEQFPVYADQFTSAAAGIPQAHTDTGPSSHG
jgi:histone-lysine N-methyltransferase SETD3